MALSAGPSLRSGRPVPTRGRASRSARAPEGGLPVWLLILGYNGGAVAAALVLHLGHLLLYAYPLGAVLVAVVLLRRRDTADYLEFVLWLWLLAPEVRRIVDLGIGWTPVSYIMLAPPLASLACLVAALSARRPVHRDASGAFAVMMVTVVFAFLVGCLTNGTSPAVASLMEWLPPVTLGAYVAGAGPATPVLHRAVKRFAISGTLVLGVYALVQFLVLPAWDKFWMENAPLSTIGSPEPFKVRAFSTLNSPGPFGSVIGCLLLLVLVGTSQRGRVVSAAAGVVGIGLSLVRGAWLGLVLSVIALARAGRVRAIGAVLVMITLPVVLLVTVGGPVGQAINDRFTSSYEAGGQDRSLSERLTFYGKSIPDLAGSATGTGLGAVGVSTKLSNTKGDLGENGDFDSGILEVLFTFGLGAGAVAMLVIVRAVSRAWARAKRSGSDFAAACGAGLIGLLAQILLGNPLISVVGVCFWLLFGVLARDDVESSSPIR